MCFLKFNYFSSLNKKTRTTNEKEENGMSFFGCPEILEGVKVAEKWALEIKFFLPLQLKQWQIA